MMVRNSGYMNSSHFAETGYRIFLNFLNLYGKYSSWTRFADKVLNQILSSKKINSAFKLTAHCEKGVNVCNQIVRINVHQSFTVSKGYLHWGNWPVGFEKKDFNETTLVKYTRG